MTQEDFFGFLNRPFQAAPQDGLFVALEPMTLAVDQLAEAARKGDGIGVLTAVSGAGKSVVCGELQARLTDEFLPIVIPSCSFPTRRSLLQGILFELGHDFAGLTEQESRLHLLMAGQSAMQTSRGVVLIVDEAHQLSPRLLEEIRCLTNHVEHGQPLFRVVLSGQLSLEERLTLPELQALNYRITSHETIDPLSMQQSAEYIDGRLQHVGNSAKDLFTNKALEIICRVSDGSPRCLNQFADACLSHAADIQAMPVDEDMVRTVLQDLKQLPLQWNDSVCDQVILDDRDSTCIHEEWSMDEPDCADMECGACSENGLDAVAKPLSSTDTFTATEAVDSDEEWTAKMISIEVGAHAGPERAGAQPCVDVETPDDATADVAPLPTVENVEMDSTELSENSVIEFVAPDPRAVEAGDTPEEPEVAEAADQADVGLQELPVDDRYAALDRHRETCRKSCGGQEELLSIDWKESEATEPHQPTESPLRIVEEHLETSDTTDRFLDASRLGRMIEALSEVVANELSKDVRPHSLANSDKTQPTNLEDNVTQDDSRWRATPFNMAYDVIEPESDEGSFGDHVESREHLGKPGELGEPSERSLSVEQSKMQETSEETDVEERPYARLFSRIRRQRMPA